jgi:hypothetical protein
MPASFLTCSFHLRTEEESTDATAGKTYNGLRRAYVTFRSNSQDALGTENGFGAAGPEGGEDVAGCAAGETRT